MTWLFGKKMWRFQKQNWNIFLKELKISRNYGKKSNILRRKTRILIQHKKLHVSKIPILSTDIIFPKIFCWNVQFVLSWLWTWQTVVPICSTSEEKLQMWKTDKHRKNTLGISFPWTRLLRRLSKLIQTNPWLYDTDETDVCRFIWPLRGFHRRGWTVLQTLSALFCSFLTLGLVLSQLKKVQIWPLMQPRFTSRLFLFVCLTESW